MEITKHTFNEQLDSILTAIEESTFLAIDGEFTGLDAEGCSHIAPFDTPEERYLKLRHGSTDFMLIQFGLCAFKVDEEKRIYEAKPYNFYVFPRPSSRNAPDRRFMCQSSSLDFLICNGFDFNKLIKEGISYLSLEQEHKMKAELERKHAEQKNRSASSVLSPDGANSKKMPLPVPDDQKEFLTDICERISVFLEGDDEELKLQSCNAFQRKLVYQTVEEKYPLVHLQTKTGEKKERFLVVQRAKDAEDLEKKEQEKQALEKMELDLQVGFTKVIKAITKSGKLVVGHNMFLDIIHSMNQFHSVLPYNLVDFKAMVKTVFPRLLDTKLLANTPPLKDFMTYTSLNDLQETMQSKPFSPVPVKPAPGFDLYNSGSVALHEAGYDAYITGCCFATMCKFLGTCQNPPSDFLLPSSKVIEPFVNKLFLMRIADIPYLNLSGPDLEVNRDHVFHVTFPQEWRASDLHSLFEPYGHVQISWLTETTAYVGLHNKTNAKTAYEALSKEKGLFHVVSYAFHHNSKAAVKRKNSGETDLLPIKMKRNSLSQEHSSSDQLDGKRAQSSDGEKSSIKNLQDDAPRESSAEELQSGHGKKLFDEVVDW